MKAKKSFGQNWLKDQHTLDIIVKSANLIKSDTILEVGPGLGYLTEKLVATDAQVIAVEADIELIPNLLTKFNVTQGQALSSPNAAQGQALSSPRPGLANPHNVEILHEDILQFNLLSLPKGYKVVANIPYYLTSNLIRMLLEADNKPQSMVLLIQKEVAQRIVARPGQMSILAFSVQYYAQPEIVADVSRELFEPVPNVDSSIVKFDIRKKPLFDADSKKLFRIVRGGFSNKRKMLKNSLSAALQIDQSIVTDILINCSISQNSRAQELDFEQWRRLYLAIEPMLK